MTHEKYHYSSMEEVAARAEALGAFLPLQEDLSPLYQPLAFGSHEARNRIVFQPMEGADSTEEGAPGELTVRRYLRFAQAGPGVIWFEAVATVAEGRSSAHQLYLTEQNVGAFQRLVEDMREAAVKATGHAPVIIMQATNSGRYSKYRGAPNPMIAYRCPPLEDTPLPDSCILSDDDLRRFESAYEQTALLCRRAGFDGMDVKACHRYLVCELLSAYTRPGAYGGSYENRTRFLKNCLRAAGAAVAEGRFFLTTRLNAYDGFPYPYGFGVREDTGLEPDLSEAARLVGELRDEFHIPLVNITMGNPYRNPHVNRPYDKGNYIPDEHPLEGVGRMMRGVSQIQRAAGLPVVASGFSYLREYSPNLAAAMVSGGQAALCGFGRMTFANPGFVREAEEKGRIDRRGVCITCGGCAQLLRAGRPTGCVIRDGEVYRL